MNSNQTDKIFLSAANKAWKHFEHHYPGVNKIFGLCLDEKESAGFIGVPSAFQLTRQDVDVLITPAIQVYSPQSWVICNDNRITVIFTLKELSHMKLLIDRLNDRLQNYMKKIKVSNRWLRKAKKGKLCVRCLDISTSKCPCLKERYCSKECQKKDWACHKLTH